MKFNHLNEAKNFKYRPTNLIEEICASMVLLNNTFLDNILDRGLRARYQENTDVFLNDLKNLLLSNNRLRLGKFVVTKRTNTKNIFKCVEDTEHGNISKYFDSLKFQIDEDWQVLVNARNTARNIIDKMLPSEKLREEQIEVIYWLGPNKTEEFQEDIVLELKDGRQFSFFLNKNVTLYKTATFNKFADELIGNEFENMFGPQYISKWNHLTRRWIEIIYTNAKKNIQYHIEKFISPTKIPMIHYFLYFNIEHQNKAYKNLGEYIKELDGNFLKFADLMSAIWKHREKCFDNPEEVYEEWMKTKVFILNSKILEHLLTESLTKNSSQDIKKLDDGFKLASGRVKMKLIKTIVEKLGCKERNMFYLGNNGNIFTLVPTRTFWREGFKHLDVKFDYHVELEVKKEERKNDFHIIIKVELEGKELMECEVGVNFGRKEFSEHLSARYKFGMENNFNKTIIEKMRKPNEPSE